MSSTALSISSVGLTVGEREPVSAVTGIDASVLARQFTGVEHLRFRVRGVQPEEAPMWLSAVERSLVALWDLSPNWDTYGSPPISRRALAASVTILYSIASRETVPPMIVPASAGGIQIEWHSNIVHIEISIGPDGEASLLMQHVGDGRFWEGPLDEHQDYVRGFLKPLRPAVLS